LWEIEELRYMIVIFSQSYTLVLQKLFQKEVIKTMKRIITLSTCKLQDTIKHGGCGACQTSCQSACKTSCGVANQKCENTINRKQEV
jgi:predicted ribosomally synthesized six-cysteine peptide SCIFF